MRPTWAELMACIYPDLTMKDEIALLELGDVAYLWWAASPYDQPQYDDGLMYWERVSTE